MDFVNQAISENPSFYVVKPPTILINNGGGLKLAKADQARRVLIVMSQSLGAVPANAFIFIKDNPSLQVFPFVGNVNLTINWTNHYSLICESFQTNGSANDGTTVVVEVCLANMYSKGYKDATGIIKELSTRIKRFSNSKRGRS